MRILKRNLAFMLAMIMALSLTAFAGYEDYPDVDELTYVEAVDVLTELGIVEGSNGKLMPTGNLTRAQAAKLIAYTMLGKKAADALQADVAPFVDVPTYHWAAGYVEYCADQGIVGGMGNGVFAPEENVTGSQFAKMLLCAVGYGENGEFTGLSWDSTVNSMATKLGVFDKNLDVVFADDVTREEAFLYTFNTLTKVMAVTYSADADEYYAGTVFNSIKGFDFDETLGAKLYNLNKKAGTDAFERDGYFWYKGAKKITGLYGFDADAVYTTKVKSKTMFADLDLDETTNAVVYHNGTKVDNFQLKKGLNLDLPNSGNGVLTEAYVDANMDVVIIMIDTYLAQVKTVNANDNEVTLNVYTRGATDPVVFNDVVVDLDLAKNDYVLVTIADDGDKTVDAQDDVITVAIPETLNGNLDNRGQTSTYTTMDGEKYSHAYQLDQASTATYDVVGNFDTEMVMIFDEYGYMIGLVEPENAAKLEGYVLVRDSQGSTTEVFLNKGSVKAEVMYMATGDVEVVDIATRRSGTGLTRNTQFWDPTVGENGNWANVTNERYIIKYGFYGYYMDANDEMRLLPLNAEGRKEAQILSVYDVNKVTTDTDTTWGWAGGSVISNNAKDEKLTFGTAGNAANLKINSKTVLNLVSTDGVESIEGYKNFEIKETAVDALVVYNNSSKYVSEIYVVNGDLFSDVVGYYNADEHMLDKNGEWITLYVGGEAQTYKLAKDALGNVTTTLKYDFVGIDGKFYAPAPVPFTAANLKDGAYEFTLNGDVLESMTLVACENWDKNNTYTFRVNDYGTNWIDLVAINGNADYNFVLGMNRKFTLADDVQIYDVVNGGVETSIDVNDKVIFVVDENGTDFAHDTFDATDAAKTIVVSHVYVVGHVDNHVVTPTPGATTYTEATEVIALSGTEKNDAYLCLKGGKSGDTVTVEIWKMIDGIYSKVDAVTAPWTGTDHATFANNLFDGSYVFKYFVGTSVNPVATTDPLAVVTH